MLTTLEELTVAFFTCLAIGVPAYYLKVVSKSGFWSGAVVGLGILIFAEWDYFWLIFAFFLISGVATKIKYEEKKKKGIAQRDKGARRWDNVFGNGLIPLIFALFEGISGRGVFLAGYLGAVATATSDTAGGEIGRLSKSDPVLITNFERVPHGTEGAISFLGTFAEFAISFLIGFLAILLGMRSGNFHGAKLLFATTISGFFGSKVDSVLGATLETKYKFWGNNSTNITSIFLGALCSILFYLWIR